ncbi:MAG: hypothetical protein PHV74_12445 [Dehalococcoidia bacterium]|nr:hypothetical protein [Dehalococcoidia bacterium]
MKRMFILASVLLVMTLMIPTVALALEGYSYYYNVSFYNSGTSEISGRFLVPTNAKALVDGHYIQDDGEDVAVTYGGTSEDVVALGLDEAGSVNWAMDYLTLAPSQTKNKTMWLGDTDAVRDQAWIGMDGDTNTVADAASLDITTNLTLQADVNLPAPPTSEQKIISKNNAYALVVDATDFIFRATKSTATSATLRPNAAGYTTNLTAQPAVANYLNVDEASTDDYSTYVHTGSTSVVTDSYSLDNGTIPADATISSVTVYYRITNTYSASGGSSQPFLYLGGNTSLGTSANIVNSFTTKSEIITRPGGGSWAVADIASLEAGIKLSAMGGFDSLCTQIYVVVTYSYPTFTEVSIGVPAKR